MRVDPPLQCLRYFEAAARLMSFKAAAAELHVTQGAISQQIRTLEDFLGVELFKRLTRSVVLTAAGFRLMDAAQKALTEVRGAVREIRADTPKHIVSVELGPFISARWLVPRLARFYQRHAGIGVRLHHCIGGGIPSSDIDVAILWGRGEWHVGGIQELIPVRVQPVCAPSVSSSEVFEHPVGGPSSLPLLHALDREDWRYWLSCAGLPTQLADTGMVYDEPNVAIEAAVAGAGIALGYFPMLTAELEAGRLVTSHPLHAPCYRDYYCLLSSSTGHRPGPALDFYNWLLSEARAGIEYEDRPILGQAVASTERTNAALPRVL